MADRNPTLLEQPLDITLAEGKAVVEPKGVADDAQGGTVTVRLPVWPGPPASRG